MALSKKNPDFIPDIGSTFYIRVGANKYKIHIVAVVDCDMVVYKYFGKHKQWWHYEIEHNSTLRYNIDSALDPSDIKGICKI
ncbi:MAG: hypothetical protein KC517_09250 [Bacteroidetes bacterium]|nr:hypothetical protein [Bacteroidota bacterium]